jgi:transposase
MGPRLILDRRRCRDDALPAGLLDGSDRSAMGDDRAARARCQSGGRPRKASSRELVNAILYALRAGCSWRLLPTDFRSWQTVYYYLQRWRRQACG